MENLTDNTTPMTPETVKDRQEKYRHKIFKFAFALIFVFGIPAFAALFAGKYVDGQQGTGRKWQLIFLAIAFVISWTFVIYRYRQYEKERRNLTKN